MTEAEQTLEERIAALEAERDERLNDLKRVAADFENYRKRAARDQESRAAHAAASLVKELIPIMDDLERALEAAAEHEESKLEESEASTIEGRIMELRQALEGEDVADIKAKTEALQEASHKLAEAVYAQATAQAQASGGGNGSSTADDEVVEEGEYEVVDEEAKTS